MTFPLRALVRPASRAAGLAVALVTVLVVGSLGPPPVAAATSTGSIEASLLARTNRDRTARGLKPLQLDTRLAGIADDRAENLAAARSFSHTAAGGSLSTPLKQASVQWYVWAENIAYWPGGLTSSTAASIYRAWRSSSSHWKALMSRGLNYVGFGVAVRASDGRVFASAVFTSSRDHSAPSARVDRATRSGSTIAFSWHGWDPPLQTHWSRIRDFDVWYRVDGGAWRLVRDNTTATSLRISNRPAGHQYEIMVRARDRAGNVGRTSAPLGVRIP